LLDKILFHGEKRVDLLGMSRREEYLTHHDAGGRGGHEGVRVDELSD